MRDNYLKYLEQYVQSSETTKTDDLKTQVIYNHVAQENILPQFDLVIENGMVVIPEQGILQTNLYIKDGKVAVLGNIPRVESQRTINAYGKYVLPGIIDPHVHFGIYSPMADELTSESKSALIGGVTTVGSFFSAERSHFTSFPVIENMIEEMSFVDVIPHLVIQTDEQKNEISDYENLLGINSFKLYMSGIPGMIPDVDDDFILDVLNKVSSDSIVAIHPENSKLVNRATQQVMEAKGNQATLLDWHHSHPDYAEEDAVIRIINFSKLMKKKVYLVHISTQRAVETIAEMRHRSPYVSVETTSPYLSISLKADELNYKMTPPLRTEADVFSLWEALNNNTIDTIGTDHVAIYRDHKERSMWDTLSGYSVVEHHLPVLWHEGISENKTDILTLIRSMTQHPAQAYGVYPKKGTLLAGSDADIVILDPQCEKTIQHEDLVSLGNFSIYQGKKVRGWPVITIKSGQIVVENGRLISQNAKGHLLKRF